MCAFESRRGHMNERYVATSAAGEPVVRTNSKAAAEAYAARLGGVVVDREEQAMGNEHVAPVFAGILAGHQAALVANDSEEEEGE